MVMVSARNQTLYEISFAVRGPRLWNTFYIVFVTPVPKLIQAYPVILKGLQHGKSGRYHYTTSLKSRTKLHH